MSGEVSSVKQNSALNSRNEELDEYRDEEMYARATSGLKEDNTFTAEEVTNLAGVGAFQVKLIVLSGFVWMARGFDTIVMKSINTLLSCDWQLHMYQGAILTTVSFLSTMLGCILYGIWSDIYGRRMALSGSLTFLFVFGAVSAGLRTYNWFLGLRAVSAFALGGLLQSLVLCCEYIPGLQRGRCIYILSCFWALGALIMMYALFATRNMEHGWRVFIAISVLPTFVAMVMMRFFPESFRFLMVKDQYVAANSIVTEMADTNKKTIDGQLAPLPCRRRRRFPLDLLLIQPYTRPTILFWFLGMMTAINFFGLQSVTREIIPPQIGEFKSMNRTINFLRTLFHPIFCTSYIPSNEMILDAWTTALDFPGFIIYLIIVDFVDRKKLLSVSYVASSVLTFLLCIPLSNFIVYVVFVYIARVLLVGQFNLLLLMNAETFPTSHRGTSVGLTASAFYLGQLLSSYIAEGLSWVSKILPIAVYGVLLFLCAVAVLFLKEETRGKELKDIMKK